MKIRPLITTLTAATLFLGMIGCKKEEVQNATDNAKDATSNLVDTVKTDAEKAVDKTKEIAVEAADKTKDVATQAVDKAEEGAEKVGEAVKDEAQKITSPTATDKAQSIIDQSKGLVDAGKFQDALSTLGGLSGMTLSDAQQKIVDDLKEQIQKALAAKAAPEDTGAVGNMMGK